jgi:transcriptional regulator with XRE-family HTH domain
MTLEDVIERAISLHGGVQSELAKAIGRSTSVIGQWRVGRYTPDYESCLALAQITGHSPIEILRLAGHDPDRLVEAARLLQANSQPDPEPEDPTDRKIRRRFRQFGEVVGRYPRAVQLAVIEANIRLAEAYGEATLEPAVNSSTEAPISSPDQRLTERKHTPSRRLAHSFAWAA